MDIDFANEKHVFLVIYLDDLTMFSKDDEDHLHHLRIVFSEMQKNWHLIQLKEELIHHGRR